MVGSAAVAAVLKTKPGGPAASPTQQEWTDAQRARYAANQRKAQAHRAETTAAATADAAAATAPAAADVGSGASDDGTGGAAAKVRGGAAHPVHWWERLETGDALRLEHAATGFRLVLLVGTTFGKKHGRGDGEPSSPPTSASVRRLLPQMR
jgi:hypothetical protein